MIPFARSKNLVVQQAENEVLVYDLDTNKAICLNETSAFIWQNCDGKKDFAGIQKSVEKKFGELVSKDFIKFAIDQLKKENLIANDEEIETGFSGLSRREVIKRIGLGSLVALPIIASLTAPMAVSAASICNTGTVCTCTMSGMDSGGAGTACAAPNTGGCNLSAMCTCLAQNNGNMIANGLCGSI